ncbi:MAG: FHA domain-containing protein [Acidobacteria bacterium]|nr:FHA domain-containing protein [Acidobacteriota bacterium]
MGARRGWSPVWWPSGLAWASRRHVRITLTPDRARLENLGSRNATFVGDRRLGEPAPLEDGIPGTTPAAPGWSSTRRACAGARKRRRPEKPSQTSRAWATDPRSGRGSASPRARPGRRCSRRRSPGPRC